MFVQALRIALTKADGADFGSLLRNAISSAEVLVRLEGNFETQINANKDCRGEKPTKLSKARRSEIDGYSSDATALQEQQLMVFESELSAIQIVVALKAGLDSDLQFWTIAAKHAHPMDRALVQELVDAKLALQASLGRCLSDTSSSVA